jgi:hypothetical protein
MVVVKAGTCGGDPSASSVPLLTTFAPMLLAPSTTTAKARHHLMVTGEIKTTRPMTFWYGTTIVMNQYALGLIFDM